MMLFCAAFLAACLSSCSAFREVTGFRIKHNKYDTDYSIMPAVVKEEGNSVGDIGGQTLEQCKALCDGETRCKSFAYGTNRNCHLKDKCVSASDPWAEETTPGWFTYYKPCDECPDKVQTNTKGYCIDASGNSAPEKCCDVCEGKLDAALHYYNKRLMFYMQQCGVTQEDVNPVGEGFVLTDDSHICSSTCQSFHDLQNFRSLGSWLDSWYKGRCTDGNQYKSLAMLHGITHVMHAAWQNCAV